MYKKITFLILIVFSFSCSFETPTKFTNEALQETLYQTDNTETTLQKVLKKYKGEKVLLNVWASWCRDCIVALPKLKELQKEFPDVNYVFLSTDRNLYSWKKALDKYKIEGSHFFVEKGMDGDLGDFLNSNWIPRYLVVNENGFVDLFKAKKITDVRIVNALKK